jgi:RNA polymerase sigma-70 factor (ECF subfamily)
MPSEQQVQRERALRRAVLAGDEAAWRAWYDESFAGLHAFARWRCAGLGDLADEVVQETWLIAVRRIRDFDPDRGSFASWLHGIAAHLLCNHFRRENRRNGRHDRLTTQPATMESAAADLERREEAERVARTLTTLPDRYEAVLRAKYLDGQSVQEIASAWNETPKAIESLLTRARQAFRTLFDGQEPSHD